MRLLRDLRTVPTSLIGVAITAAQDSITAPTMGMEVITGIGMEGQPIGVTVPGRPTVHEAVLRTGMTGPEVRPDGVVAPRRGAAGPARFMGPVVAPVHGGVEPTPALARESAPYPASMTGRQIAVTNGCLARGFLIEPLNEA